MGGRGLYFCTDCGLSSSSSSFSFLGLSPSLLFLGALRLLLVVVVRAVLALRAVFVRVVLVRDEGMGDPGSVNVTVSPLLGSAGGNSSIVEADSEGQKR